MDKIQFTKMSGAGNDFIVIDNRDGRVPLLIAVHGYAAHMRYMMREAKLIAPSAFAIASLQGPNRFFRPAKDGQYRTAFGWLNDFESEEQVSLHHEFILKLIQKHSDADEIDPEQVYLYGFSQSCALNFKFAFTNPKVLKGLIGVCGGIPGGPPGGIPGGRAYCSGICWSAMFCASSDMC